MSIVVFIVIIVVMLSILMHTGASHSDDKIKTRKNKFASDRPIRGSRDRTGGDGGR